MPFHRYPLLKSLSHYNRNSPPDFEIIRFLPEGKVSVQKQESKTKGRQKPCPLHFSKNTGGSDASKSPPGHGDSAALCETTRRWFFHGKRRGLRPSASLCGNPLVSPLKAEIPARAFANRVAIPGPSPSFPLKGKYQKCRETRKNHPNFCLGRLLSLSRSATARTVFT